MEQDNDMNSFVTKSHLFGAQRALHQEQQATSNERTHRQPRHQLATLREKYKGLLRPQDRRSQARE